MCRKYNKVYSMLNSFVVIFFHCTNWESQGHVAYWSTYQETRRQRIHLSSFSIKCHLPYFPARSLIVLGAKACHEKKDARRKKKKCFLKMMGTHWVKREKDREKKYPENYYCSFANYFLIHRGINMNIACCLKGKNSNTVLENPS